MPTLQHATKFKKLQEPQATTQARNYSTTPIHRIPNPNAGLRLSLFHGSVQIFIPSISPVPLAAQVSWSTWLSWAGSWLRPQEETKHFSQLPLIHFPYRHWLFHWMTCGLMVTGSALKGLAVTSPGKHRGEARVLSKRSFQIVFVHLHVVCFHLPIQPAHVGSGRTKMRSFRKMQHATVLHWCQVAIIFGQGLSKLAGLRPWSSSPSTTRAVTEITSFFKTETFAKKNIQSLCFFK